MQTQLYKVGVRCKVDLEFQGVALFTVVDPPILLAWSDSVQSQVMANYISDFGGNDGHNFYFSGEPIAINSDGTPIPTGE